MRLLPIQENTWSFYAPCNHNDQCELLDFLTQIDAKFEKSAARLLSIIETASREVAGPKCFDDGISHYVNQNEKIYEFVTGRLRLLWFYSPKARKVIICSHVFLKSTQKTPPAEVKKAIKVKTDYESAFKKKQIEIVYPEEQE